MIDAHNYDWRAILDRLDADLHASGALADEPVFTARRALGRAIGVLVVSAETGRRINVTARTFPPYDDNGAMDRPAAEDTP